MEDIAIRLLCSSSVFTEELITALSAKCFIVDSRAEWSIVIDLPVGWVWVYLARQSLDLKHSIVVTENPCPEYRRDLSEFGFAAVTSLVSIDCLSKKVYGLCSGNELSTTIMTPLTRAEQLTLKMAASDFSNQQIAEARGVSVGTVKNTLSMIYLKLNLKQRSQASHYYYGRWDQLTLKGWKPPMFLEKGVVNMGK